MEKLIESGIVDVDEVTNVYTDNSDEINAFEIRIEELENDGMDEDTEKLQEEIEELEQEQEEAKDIYEWWLISDWIARKLEEQNECMLNTDYGTWWGRTCTGHSISMDYVIEQIVRGLYHE